MSMRAFKTRYVSLSEFTLRKELSIAIVYPPRGAHRQHALHEHDCTEIALILEGAAVHNCNGNTVPLVPGDVVIIPPGVEHNYLDAESMMVLNLLCQPEKLLGQDILPEYRQFFNPVDEHGKYNPAPMYHLDMGNRNAYMDIISQLKETISKPMPGSALACISGFCNLLQLLAACSLREDSDRKKDFHLGEVILYLNKSFHHNISIDQLCSRANMSKRNFFRVFKRLIGTTPAQYINDLRLHHAAQQLLLSEKTIKEIATESGFCDSNFLCKLFKRKYGKTPHAYRQHSGI